MTDTEARLTKAQLPRVTIVEEGMREGMQIESAAISVDAKVRLLDALSQTGLKNIVAGSFVSPRWVPQMKDIDDILHKFTPVAGVTYTALSLNQQGDIRKAEHTPPLAPPDGVGRSMLHLCDVFLQRNTARTLEQERAALADTIGRAVDAGVSTAIVAVNAAWGSNWLGEFSEEQRMEALAFQADAWLAAGIPTTGVYLGDPMSWNTPRVVRAHVRNVIETWPELTSVHLHLHNGRGAAPLSAYAALHELDQRHELIIDSSIGGMGGCPYCGNGRATKMIPTEDLVFLLESEGIDTGVDLPALIEAAHLAEEVVGHELYGHVSQVGALPAGQELYAMDMPLIETIAQAQHFRLGPETYADGSAPWKSPITSVHRDESTSDNGSPAGGASK
jgi:hydroxymethylglutaryl-CoA lyase